MADTADSRRIDPAQTPPAPEGGQARDRKDPKAKEPKTFGGEVYTWLQALVIALTVLVLLFTFVGGIIGVDGHSMDNTLHDRDLMLVQSIAYEPKQGDVVVLHKDFGDITTPIVKRVIAVAGQTVEINYATSTVYVDGVPLEEDYILEPMEQPTSADSQQTYWEVPEGCVFVMGDNRNHSTDSRDDDLGPVDTRYIIGRAVAVVFPFDHIGLIE